MPVRRYSYKGAAIVVWMDLYETSELVGRRVADGLSATVDGHTVPIELRAGDGEGELLAKVRLWIDAQ